MSKKGVDTKKTQKKRKINEVDEDTINLKLMKEGEVIHSFILSSDLFTYWDHKHNFAILKFPISTQFSMLKRIPIRLGIYLNQKIHAFGYIGHTNELNFSGGEITSKIPLGFTINLLSDGGYSGAAIFVNYNGGAVGYMGGNVDASDVKNSQHQSYGFKYDLVLEATKRGSTYNINRKFTKFQQKRKMNH